MKDNAIRGFYGKYLFLSNFFIEPDGTHVEGEFQMAKCANADDKKLFLLLPPDKAKVLGNQVRLIRDWDISKYAIMKKLVLKKFQDHPNIRRWLLQTGQDKLVEENTWNDKIWGTVDGKGQNWLGNILMDVRKQLAVDLTKRVAM